MHGEPGGVAVSGAHEVLRSAVILSSVTPLSVPDIIIIIISIDHHHQFMQINTSYFPSVTDDK